ncbi:hypothetical protein [Streptomyces fagopyri]|uniref:hypothetical protein n=1 Tax=Streptomyces fagopyri TaxID=2662397 RepID=UPI003713806F
MESATMSAVIAAVAAMVGCLLTAFATRSVEWLRLRTSLLEKARERRLAGIEGFMLATSLWMGWLTYSLWAAVHQAWWTGVNLLAERACSRAVELGKAPGSRTRIFR